MAQPSIKPPGGDKINILVVDDLPEKVLVLDTILGELGENIVVARSGEEALREILQRDFAVILLDVNMPSMDGYETASLIRRRRRSAYTPIIFITGYADELHNVQGYSLGAVDYILSPVVPDVLRTKVRVFVELFRMAEQAKHHADERLALVQEQAARAAAEEASRRFAFLAEASAALGGSLDYEAKGGILARLMVPFLADWGAMVGSDRPAGAHQAHRIERTELAWLDEGDRLVTHTAAGAAGLSAPVREAALRVLAGGRRELLPSGAEAPLCLAGAPAGGTSARPPGAWREALVLPLRVGDNILGALALGRRPSRPPFSSGDFALAEDLAGRAAVFLENARLYRDIQEVDNRKNEFLAMLGHELRNPLAAISNAVALLQRHTSVGAAPQLAAGVIERQVGQLVRLVDDLLDVSRITQGKIRLQTAPVDLSLVLDQAVELSRPIIRTRSHELSVTVPGEKIWVHGDVARLAQVVANLLHNAAKYTDEGGRIWLTLERAGGEAVIRVRDTGVGIPESMQASIFEMFTQVNRSLDRAQGGLGIGLTLVQRLVQKHAGHVEVFSSGLNQGSEFIVRLPLMEQPLSAPPTAPAAPAAAASARQKRVLLVDDNIDAAQMLGDLLEADGHLVRLVHDGHEVVAAAEVFRPDVVLLDIGLPGLDGYEVARRLRGHRQLAGVLLVALTGYGQEADRQRSRDAGFDHHVVKPVDLDALSGLLAGAT